MKNLTYSFLIITIILIDCNYSIAQKNEALSRSNFNIADNQEIAIDSIVKELKNEYILQLPEKDNFNSAVLRAFEQDNIGIKYTETDEMIRLNNIAIPIKRKYTKDGLQYINSNKFNYITEMLDFKNRALVY